jgi:hypothetical protein
MSDPGSIGTAVRNWVHYDNLASSFYKQASSARKVRDDYEDRIVNHLKTNAMEHAIIQIGGGRMSVVEEKKPCPLTLAKLEELMHMYYRSKGGRDETMDVMNFIKANRGHEVKKCLKKYNMTAPPVPPLPQLKDH